MDGTAIQAEKNEIASYIGAWIEISHWIVFNKLTYRRILHSGMRGLKYLESTYEDSKNQVASFMDAWICRTLNECVD
ncbi:hypothetical protein [Neobacillus drentensis]|uniref:hypothetical protein n=1 Tax=Neobacillus drentensis TaxID=220684 RepID=UPI000A66C4B9